MIFKRKAYEELKKWKEKYGKNYVAFLEGPRRVGKSTIVEEFAKNEFKSYTKIDFVVNELQVTRQTASRYLDDIVAVGLLSKHKIGKDNFYINDDLFQLLSAVGEQELP